MNNPKMTEAYKDLLNRKSNAYFDFIEECRKKTYPDGTRLWIHHIVPRFHYRNHQLDQSTFDEEINRVQLSYEDHVISHKIRFEVSQESGDQVAFLRMTGHEEEGFEEGFIAMLRAGQQAMVAGLRREGRMFFNPEWQREMANRSMARPDALETRSQGGRTARALQNRGRVINKNDRYEWSWKGKTFMCTFDFDQTSELLKVLTTVQESRIKRISPLLNGSRKVASGWSVQKIVDKLESIVHKLESIQIKNRKSATKSSEVGFENLKNS